MTSDDYKRDLRSANVARQKEWDAFNQLTLAYRGNELAGEVGEACNVIKKLERERLGIAGSRDTIAHLAEELADVIICTDLIAMQAGIDLDAAVVAKFNASSEKVGLKTRLAAGERAASVKVGIWLDLSGGHNIVECGGADITKPLHRKRIAITDRDAAPDTSVGVGLREALERRIKFDDCVDAEPSLRMMIRAYYGRIDDPNLAQQYADRFIKALAAANQSDGGLNGQARNPVGLPDSSGDLASAGEIAGVDITDHHRQVGGNAPSDTPPAPQAVEAVSVDELALVLVNARRRQNGLDELTADRMKTIGLWPLKAETMYAARALLAKFKVVR